jgi:hypothetical protein
VQAYDIVRQFQFNKQLFFFFQSTLMLDINILCFFLLSRMELLLININLTLSLIGATSCWLDNLFFLLVIHFVLFMATHIDIPLSIHHVAVDQQQLQHLFTTIVSQKLVT